MVRHRTSKAVMRHRVGNHLPSRVWNVARENTVVDQQEALLRAFRVTESDLEANRAGRLGPAQRRRTLRNVAVGVAIGLALSVWILIATYNQARTPGVAALNWIIPGLVGLLVAAATVSGAWVTLRAMRRPVECVTGTVSLSLARVGRGGTAARLHVAARSFTLARPPHTPGGVIPAYRSMLTDGEYHVYVQGLRLLGLEPVSATVLDRAAEHAGSVEVIGDVVPRLPRVTWFAKACIVFLLLATVGMGIGGVYLTVVQFTGTPASATVTDCVQDQDARYPGVTYDCTGTWTVGGSLVGGNGHVVVGTVDGVDNTDVGKTIEVRLAGGAAYAESLALPLILMGIGFPAAALIGFLLLRVQRGH
jgi:hypothetical protein